MRWSAAARRARRLHLRRHPEATAEGHRRPPRPAARRPTSRRRSTASTRAERLLERVPVRPRRRLAPVQLPAHARSCGSPSGGGIPVVMLWNAYGVLRFSRLVEESHLRDWSDVPTPAEQLRRLPADREETPGRGRAARTSIAVSAGRTADAVAVRAYQRRQVRVDRALLARELGWDPSRPVMAVYAPNWFDFPHSSGLQLLPRLPGVAARRRWSTRSATRGWAGW